MCLEIALAGASAAEKRAQLRARLVAAPRSVPIGAAPSGDQLYTRVTDLLQ